MKRLLLACCILALTGTAASAQTAKQTAPVQESTAAIEPKLLFSSKINELDAFLTRGVTSEAQKAFQDLLSMMTNRMKENKDQKSAVAKQQQELYTAAKQLSGDLQKNHKPLVESMHKFLQSY